MEMSRSGTDEFERACDWEGSDLVAPFATEEMKKSQKVCSLQNSSKVINECDNPGDKYNGNIDRCDSMEHTLATFAYVPFNSPQEGFSDIFPAGDHTEGSTVLEEVSKTLASLYCDDKCLDHKISQPKCHVNNIMPFENVNERQFTGEESQTEEINHEVETGISNQHAIFSMEENKCENKLSECEISKHKTNHMRVLSSKCTSLSHQIKFASKLELMPACLQKVSNQTENENRKICSSECIKIEQKLPSHIPDVGKENCNLNCIELAENSPDDPISMDVLSNGCSQIQYSCHSVPIETNFSEDYRNDESCKDCMIQSNSQTDATSISDNSAFECYISSNTEEHGLMETSHLKVIPCLSNGNDCNLTESFDRQLIADVKITMEDLLEKCFNVFGEDDENANTSINQYAGKQSGSGVNRLDMRAENESGLYSECTSLAEYLKAGSGHTNSSTINEANTSDLMKIGEPSADCQVPMAMPCHVNKQQEIEKSHENVAALALHSSQNDICRVGQWAQASPKLMDSTIQFPQVSKESMQEENIPSDTPQKCISDNRLLRCGLDLHAEGLKMNEALILKSFSLKKNDLISGSGACSNQVEKQFPEISLQETLLSSTDVSVSDFHSDIAVIEEMTMRKEESCTEETALVSRREDICIGENKHNQAYSTSEDFKKCSEIADQNLGEIGTWDQCSKFEDFHKENVHSAEDVECEREILPAETNDDISHPSSSSKALNPNTWKGDLTIHTELNENVMDLYGTGSQELLVEDVSESKNTVNRVHIESTSITAENDLAETMLNNPFPQSTVLSETSRTVIDMQNMCSQSHQMTETVPYIELPVSENNNCYHQHEDYQLMCTQQFTASLSQVNIVDYLKDNGDNYDLQADILSTSKDECFVPDTEDDHIVPSVAHPSEYESDVTIYDDGSQCLMKEKEQAKVEPFSQQPSCFKWKYAPSLNLDDMPLSTTDSRQYDEDAMLTVLPLKTCTRPIRVGLSKKYRAKPLHNKNYK